MLQSILNVMEKLMFNQFVDYGKNADTQALVLRYKAHIVVSKQFVDCCKPKGNGLISIKVTLQKHFSII